MTYKKGEVYSFLAEYLEGKHLFFADTKLSDLELDSLGVVELLMALEDKYSITLEDSYVDWNLGDLEKFIESNHASV